MIQKLNSSFATYQLYVQARGLPSSAGDKHFWLNICHEAHRSNEIRPLTLKKLYFHGRQSWRHFYTFYTWTSRSTRLDCSTRLHEVGIDEDALALPLMCSDWSRQGNCLDNLEPEKVLGSPPTVLHDKSNQKGVPLCHHSVPESPFDFPSWGLPCLHVDPGHKWSGPRNDKFSNFRSAKNLKQDTSVVTLEAIKMLLLVKELDARLSNLKCTSKNWLLATQDTQLLEYVTELSQNVCSSRMWKCWWDDYCSSPARAQINWNRKLSPFGEWELGGAVQSHAWNTR